MPQYKTPTWQTNLTNILCQDPRKTGLLGFLVVILMVMAGRMMLVGSHPTLAAGSSVIAIAGAPSAFVPSPVLKPGGAAASLRGWLSKPILPIGRNDFLVRSEYFPTDGTRTSPLSPGNSFWSDLGKSLSVQADQKEKRDAVIVNLKVQAAALRPTSIAMGSAPRAMVDGMLVREGDTVNSFRVIRIEPHCIVVQSQGIGFVVPMN